MTDRLWNVSTLHEALEKLAALNSPPSACVADASYGTFVTRVSPARTGAAIAYCVDPATTARLQAFKLLPLVFTVRLGTSNVTSADFACLLRAGSVSCMPGMDVNFVDPVATVFVPCTYNV